MRFFLVNAFTEKIFSGNPAAVVPLEKNLPDSVLLSIAGEFNYSETAFIMKRSDDAFDLRWFSPLAEVELCGHATLAAAHMLLEMKVVNTSRKIEFHTRSGLLTARTTAAGIQLDFPSSPVQQVSASFELAKALGHIPQFVGKTNFDYLILFETEKIVRELDPDFFLLKKVPTRGVIITAKSDPDTGYDFVSRFFCPSLGISEDPVTGSAHCALGPFWMNKLNKRDLMAYQASKRGGSLKIGFVEDRVLLTGKAVTVARGEFSELQVLQPA
ncbi:MAG: PhzF family phenazine biosynthesis isomerase [Verrucomicrobiota bacterium]|nr:PhzF family phenazine biosynthesis isomerase [Verrucomicrobiota bacterium]